MANPFLGVLLHAVGGLAAGSFYVPFRRVLRWAWESYWLVQGVLAWLVMPWVGALLTAPRAVEILQRSSGSSVALAYLFGVLWGVGGLTFGLSMRYLGLSLGYAVALGFCAAFGTLIPPIAQGKAGSLLATAGGLTVLAGIAVCLAGIAVCGYAGIRKERELTDAQKHEAVREFALGKGFAVAIFAGIMSACMAFGISAGAPIAHMAVRLGTPAIHQNNPVFIPIMAGGFTTNVAWCLALNVRNRTLRDYVTGSPALLARNYLFAGLAGVIWYLQFFFYGMGTTQMGRYDFSSWTIHMAFIIVFSNLWGIGFHEWRGVRRVTMAVVWAGIAVLILSTVIIGAGNYLASR
ncbi:MAG: L-rhamnose/proton symporter RhaT [Chthonomonadales bacterium]|nr:L-rhamnose/proton symporter RhaT [Chthonomonadales bacterium]